MLAKHFFKHGQKPDRPAVDRRMVNKHTAFFHQFLQMAVALWIRRVPTDANQNYVDWEAHSFGRQHRVSSLFSQGTQHRPAGGLTANATEPEIVSTDQGSQFTARNSPASCWPEGWDALRCARRWPVSSASSPSPHHAHLPRRACRARQESHPT